MVKAKNARASHAEKRPPGRRNFDWVPVARGELAVHQVADHDHRPRENHEYRGHGGDQVERAEIESPA